MFTQDTKWNRKLKQRLRTSITDGTQVSNRDFRQISSLYHCSSHARRSVGRPLYAELSPVTDFREACCRQNENGECNRGGFCNFMHLRLPTKDLQKAIHNGQRLERRLNPHKIQSGGGGWEPGKREGGRGRSASPHRRNKDGEDRWTRK